MKRLSESELRERAAKVGLLVLDVDGVLTDGSIVYGNSGEELKRFHVRDGAGIKLWQLAGHTAAIISGRKSVAVERRAAELGVGIVRQGVADKRAELLEVAALSGHSLSQVAAIGDDLPDLPMQNAVGLSITVADGCPEMRESAHHATMTPGGHGAVREAIEWLLKLQGRWAAVIERFKPAG